MATGGGGAGRGAAGTTEIIGTVPTGDAEGVGGGGRGGVGGVGGVTGGRCDAGPAMGALATGATAPGRPLARTDARSLPHVMQKRSVGPLAAPQFEQIVFSGRSGALSIGGICGTSRGPNWKLGADGRGFGGSETRGG
jgi:hypothetical protein